MNTVLASGYSETELLIAWNSYGFVIHNVDECLRCSFAILVL